MRLPKHRKSHSQYMFKKRFDLLLNIMPQYFPSLYYLETMTLDRLMWLAAIQLFHGCWRSKLLKRTLLCEVEAKLWTPLPPIASRVIVLFSYVLGWRCLPLLLLLIIIMTTIIIIIIADNKYWSFTMGQTHNILHD